MTSRRERAVAFADALDHDDFERARTLLAADCTYDVRGATLRGADAILRSYADATRSAHGEFDEVRYESVVDDDGSRVHFTDILVRRGQEHRHRCAQHLEFGEDGRILRIVHEDLPGERAALAAFRERCGPEPGK